ncbi:MAG: hypothetical protein GY862_08450 [Gammaproteobacteria bacterium]|nr:hypothetical protein [Gammaproteobacteria bacterium]
MIDNHKETIRLMKDMKEVLPIPAYPTKHLIRSLRDSGDIRIKSAEKLEIDSLFYMGMSAALDATL